MTPCRYVLCPLLTYRVQTRMDFPGSSVVKEFTCQWRRCRSRWFDFWIGKIPWRRKWKPTLIDFPWKSHGYRSLAGSSLWGHKELHMTEHACTLVFPNNQSNCRRQKENPENSSPCCSSSPPSLVHLPSLQPSYAGLIISFKLAIDNLIDWLLLSLSI